MPRLRAAALVLALFSGVVGAYWYWSPLWIVRQMQAAARAGDGATFNEYVDYGRLRESLKPQLAVLIGAPPPAPGASANGPGAWASALVRAMSDRLIDALVRTEVVMQLMRVGRLAPREGEPSPAAPSAPAAAGSGRLVWTDERPGPDRYVVYALREGADPAQRIGLVFERSGFARWRLVELRIDDAR
jgi:hypothetical protein